VTDFPDVAALFHANTLRGKVTVDEFKADFCAGETAPPVDASGFLTPGRYTFEAEISTGASRTADVFDGVLVTEGTAAGSAELTVNLVLG